MKALIAAIALILLGPAQAQPLTSLNIKVYFSPQAKASIGTSNIGDWINTKITDEMNTVFLQSGAATRLNSTASYSTEDGICCGTFNNLSNDAFGNNILNWAANNVRIMEGRDKAFGGAGADIIILVVDSATGAGSSSLMNCTMQTLLGQARRAIIAINKSAPSGTSVTNDLAKAFADVSCANSGNASPYWWIQPGSPSTCVVFNTAGGVKQSRTANVWQGALSPGGWAGYGNTALDSGTDAASKCPSSNGMGATYVCDGVSASVSGTTATLSYTLHVTTTPPGTTTHNTQSGSAGLSSVTCNNHTMLNLYSKNGANFLGHPRGDATHDSAGFFDSSNPTLTSYRTVKIAPRLKAAALNE